MAPGPKRPTRAEIDNVLRELGVPATGESRGLLKLLSSDPGALHRVIRRLSAYTAPDESKVPDIDGLVNDRMAVLFKNCTDKRLLRKRRAMGSQNRLLLAFLLERIGQPVPLQELLLVN